MTTTQRDPYLRNDSTQADCLWTKTNLGEAFSAPMTPLTWSIAQYTFKDLAYLPDFPVLGIIGGWPYFNFSSLATALHLLGLSQKKTVSMMEELLNLRLPAGVEVPLLPYSRRKTVQVVGNFLRYFAQIRSATQRVPAYLTDTPIWFAHCKRRLEQTETPVGLLKVWREDIQAHLLQGFWVVMSTANASLDYTSRLRKRLAQVVSAEDANVLLTSLSSDNELLASLGPVVGLSQVVRGQMTRDTYLLRYGHRGAQELELAVPPPMEAPDWLEQEIARFQTNPIDVEAMIREQKRTNAATWSRFALAHSRLAQSIQRQLLENARRARVREQVRSEYVRDRWLVRLFALRVGTVCGIGPDVFYLSLGEVLALLSGSHDGLTRIAARKQARQQWMALPPYPPLIRGAFEPLQWSVDPDRHRDSRSTDTQAVTDASTRLTGSPGSAGKVEGLVRVLADPAEGDLLRPGEILVAVQTDIAWTLLFPRAAAVITDVGAVLSHAAIVARELGIPAVVGCGDATTRLKTGDRVRVDGAKGTVEIV